MSDIAKKQKIDSIDYVVKVSKRKGIRMSIAPEGELVVHADPFCSDDTIKQFVKQYTDKIKVQSHSGMIRLFGKSFKIKRHRGRPIILQHVRMKSLFKQNRVLMQHWCLKNF